MQPLVMVTNGGDHPPEKWADVTATNIANLIQVDPDKPGDTDADRSRKTTARRAKDRLQLDVADILTPHYDRNQKFERGKLAAEGDARIAGPFSAYDKKDEVVAAVVAASVDTAFAEHFAKPEVQVVIGKEIDDHFAHMKWVTRSWHADKNPGGANAKAMLASKSAA